MDAHDPYPYGAMTLRRGQSLIERLYQPAVTTLNMMSWRGVYASQELRFFFTTPYYFIHLSIRGRMKVQSNQSKIK